VSRRLRIVTVCRTFPTPDDPSGGVFILNRVAAMAQQADVAVLHAIPHFPLVRPLADWGRSDVRKEGGLQIENAPMFYLPGMLKSLDAGWLARSVATRIERLHRERPIDLIDAHFGYPEGVGCESIARRMNIPLFITIRGFEKEFVDRPLIGSRMLAAMSRTKGVVSVSHSLRKFAIERGIPGHKIQVVHNAVDTSRFCYGPSSTAREGLGVSHGVPLVVSVGHLIPRKRHNVLINAFATLQQRNPGARLAIIGSTVADASHTHSLRAQVRQLGLDECVDLLGNRPPSEVVNWLRAADLFALATAREGCCNAILEALAVGVPVVSTPVGDNDEFVEPERNGALVPIDDAHALAMAMDRMLRRKDWDRPGISAALHAQVGDWSDVAVRVLDFFEASL
jgi:teichuronic acid biosynthesis glycosyltransferase TuaC